MFEVLQLKESKQSYPKKNKIGQRRIFLRNPRKEWIDDVDSWLNVTYIPVGIFFLFSKSCYTEDKLKNYKSLNCNLNLANGWVQDVFISELWREASLDCKGRIQELRNFDRDLCM